jgi:hypothetical protein
MQVTKKILISFGCFFIFCCLHAQTDSSRDCETDFLGRGEKISAPNKTTLLTITGKTIRLANFLKTTDIGEQTQCRLFDLDSDGKKELVTYSNTGGAHCCDELYFWKNIGLNKYQYAGKTYAGDVCITARNEFQFYFDEQFGYFFTCYACAYEDTTQAGPIPIHNIVLKYWKGKLVVLPGDQELKSQITDNLEKLHEQPYEKLESDSYLDNGLRKEFAMNLAVFYFSFGRNILETKKIFDEYYTFPDAKKVWGAFAVQIRDIRRDNNF